MSYSILLHVVSYSILSCLILCCLFYYLILSYSILSCFIPSYLVLSNLILFNIILSCTDVCFEPIMKGPCKAYITRYAYDPDLDLCVPFEYGGCSGNNNNFETLGDCLGVCGNCHPVRCKNCPYEDFVDRQGCRTCECFGKIGTDFGKVGTVW